MSWEFSFKKNIYMYCHELKCKKGNMEFYCPSEDSAQEDNVVLFWLDELPLKESQLDDFVNGLEAWAIDQGLKFQIFLEQKCLSSHIS